MKNLKYLIYLFSVVVLSSCVTGAIDENPQLDELNDAIAFSPKVKDIRVNGTVLPRNTISLYQVDAKVDDVLIISVDFEAGQGATLAELQFEQNFHNTEVSDPDSIFPRNADEDAASNYTFGPVDPGTNGTFEPEDILFPLSGTTMTFDYTYTVPAVDPFVFFYTQDPGQVISIHYTIRGSNDHFAHKGLVINIVE